MPTLTSCDGYEHQTASQTGLAGLQTIYQNINTSGVSFVTGRWGGHAVRIAETSGTQGHLRSNVGAGSAGTTDVVGLWFKINALPTSITSSFLYWEDSGSGLKTWIGVDTSGHLVASGASGTAQQVTSGTYDDGEWHWLSAKSFTGGTSWTIDWEVDGAAQTQMSEGGHSTINTTFYAVGKKNSDTMDLSVDIDDLVESKTGADHPLAAYRVNYSLPDGDGTHNLGSGSLSKSTGGTTNVNDVIDDWPSAGDYITQAANDASAYLEWTFQDAPANVSSFDLVRAIFNTSASGSTADAATVVLVDSGGTTFDTPINNLDLSNTTLQYNTKVLAAPAGGWSSDFNGIKGRFGFSGNTATSPRLGGFLIEYAYPDPTPTPQAVDVTTTVTASLTAHKNSGQAVAATTTLTAGLSTKKNVGQAVAATTTLSVGLLRSRSVGQLIAATTSLTASLVKTLAKLVGIAATTTITPAATAEFSGPTHADIANVMPSLRQRVRVTGTATRPQAGLGWTITLEAV